jgi:D-alanine-D-alanine ligase
MKVAVAYNLKKDAIQEHLPHDFFAECDELHTVEMVAKALSATNDVALVEADESCYEVFRKIRPDVVFNMAEGIWGLSRESHIPSILEMLQIPYTGSGPLTLALCLDKARCKEVLSYYGIPNAAFRKFESRNDITHDLRLPVIVKPIMEGSSKGISDKSVCKSYEEAREAIVFVQDRYKQPALVEEFLPGREFTVALMGNYDKIKVLPIVEILLDNLPSGANRIYSREAKWVWDIPESPLQIFQCPAEIDSVLEQGIRELCVKTFRVLDCRDWCRIDVRLDAFGVPNVIEVNPLPGILPNPEDNSCFPKAARAAGYTYDEMIGEVLSIAMERISMQEVL